MFVDIHRCDESKFSHYDDNNTVIHSSTLFGLHGQAPGDTDSRRFGDNVETGAEETHSQEAVTIMEAGGFRQHTSEASLQHGDQWHSLRVWPGRRNP